jgi:hypothetical protein
MQLRRSVAQALLLPGPLDEIAIEETVLRVREVHAAKRHKLFKKASDTPLGDVLKSKRRRLGSSAAG